VKIVLPKGFAMALAKSNEDEQIMGKPKDFFIKKPAPNPRLGSGK
jgi:hypothetical protein